MIKKVKIHDLLAEIHYEGMKIGHIEKVRNGYIVEVLYTRRHITKKRQGIIDRYIERVFYTHRKTLTR